MMQQFVHHYDNEEEKQNRLISVDRVCSAFLKISGKSSTSLTTKGLFDSVSSLAKKQNTKKQKLII
jgi:hypothetical protein